VVDALSQAYDHPLAPISFGTPLIIPERTHQTCGSSPEEGKPAEGRTSSRESNSHASGNLRFWITAAHPHHLCALPRLDTTRHQPSQLCALPKLDTTKHQLQMRAT
jgi:hypothetical protein